MRPDATATPEDDPRAEKMTADVAETVAVPAEKPMRNGEIPVTDAAPDAEATA